MTLIWPWVSWLKVSIAAILSLSFFALASFANPLPDEENLLTPTERAWLQAHPNIGLAVDVDWAPFEFVDGHSRYQGMAADYIRLVEKKLGIAFAIDKTRPWPEMVEAVKKHDLDAFSLVVRTPQRDQFVNFTKPYISFPMVIVTRDDKPFVDGVQALRSEKVSVVKSYASHDLLAKNHPDLNLDLVKSVREGLERVSTGKSHAFVGNLAVVGRVIREAGITNIKISGQTPYRFELSMAVRKDWPELVPILQKALDSIKPQQRDEIYNRWIRVKFQNEVDYTLVFVVLIAGVGITAIILMWNRRLQIEIAHRHSVEAALKAKTQHLDEIIWGTDAGTWELNVQTGEAKINEKWAEIAGYTRDELKPSTIGLWMSMVHPDDVAEIDEQRRKHFAKEIDHYEVEVRIRHKNGQWIWTLDRGKVVEWSKDGQALRMSGTHQDITERKKLDRMKTDFVSTVSHELRTPLTSIKGSLGLIEGGVTGDLPERVRDMVSVAYSNTNRLINLVNDILDMEKLDSGGMEFEFLPMDLSQLVLDTLEANKGLAQEYGVQFELGEFTHHARVKGDAERLAQVLSNLLSNAAKFSPSEGVVRVSVLNGADQVQVSVCDQGSGIDEDFQDQIFGRFAQADASDSRIKGGTGLGLNISRSIVMRHGGEIGFWNNEGGGSTFYFSLPSHVK